jgi:hypothetical protein
VRERWEHEHGHDHGKHKGWDKGTGHRGHD